MRVGVSTVLVAVFAVAIVTVLLAAPFAKVQAHDPEGNLQRDEVLGFQAYHNARATAESEGEPLETVPGTGYLYMLLPAVGLGIFGILFLAGHAMPGRAGEWAILGAGSLTGLMAAFVLHANALWAGKAIAQTITNMALGSDGPPRVYRAMIRDHSPVDLFSSFIPISAGIVVALCIGLFVVLGMAWRRNILDAHAHETAQRQGRLLVTMAVLLTVTLALPMVIQNMPDGLAQAGSDRDTFVWSVQDIVFLREVSWNEAFAVGESGLILWDGLTLAFHIGIALLVIGIATALLGLVGAHLEDLGQTVLGRLLTNASLASVIVGLVAMVLGVLAAYVLHHPNDVFEARTTGIPLLVSIAGLAATIHAGQIARHVLGRESGVVADDFPEPVVYE